MEKELNIDSSLSSATVGGGGGTAGGRIISTALERDAELATLTRLPVEVVRAHTHPIDLGLFSTRAAIDWIAVRIRTSEPRRFETLQSVIRRSFRMDEKAEPYVCVVESVPGNPSAGTHFAVKLHDLRTAAELRRFVADLKENVGVAQEPAVIRLEVAVDFRSRKRDFAHLQAMTRQLMLAHNMVHHSERQYWARGGSRVDDLNFFSPEDTWASGHDEPHGAKAYVDRLDPLARVYLKMTDNGKRPIDDERDLRARMEARVDAVDLFGKEVPTDYLHLLDFNKFKPYLRTWRITHHWLQAEPPCGWQGERALAWSRIQRSVLAKGHRRASFPPRPRRRHPDGIAPYRELNDRVRWALRDLRDQFFPEAAEKRRKRTR